MITLKELAGAHAIPPDFAMSIEAAMKAFENCVFKPITREMLDGNYIEATMPGTIRQVCCTISIRPDKCECGSGSNKRGPGHSYYCKLLEA